MGLDYQSLGTDADSPFRLGILEVCISISTDHGLAVGRSGQLSGIPPPCSLKKTFWMTFRQNLYMSTVVKLFFCCQS